jgi:hypothetical protein
MTPEMLKSLLQPVMQVVAADGVTGDLEDRLRDTLPPDSPAFAEIEAACHAAIAEGWMCAEGEGNRRFGRVIEPAADTNDLSVDVVDMIDLRGGHHTHPTGEVLMIMPQDADAKFDGRGKGWLVYAPGTGHRPTVRGGRTLVLYLLPEGKIEWTGT